ncbi:MAG: hypothetical protein V1792_16295 [Pseudomonadota bacterium]
MRTRTSLGNVTLTFLRRVLLLLCLVSTGNGLVGTVAFAAPFNTVRVTIAVTACNPKTGEKKTITRQLYYGGGLVSDPSESGLREKQYQDWAKKHNLDPKNRKQNSEAWLKYKTQSVMKQAVDYYLSEWQSNQEFVNTAGEIAGNISTGVTIVTLPFAPQVGIVSFIGGNLVVSGGIEAAKWAGQAVARQAKNEIAAMAKELADQGFTKNLKGGIWKVEIVKK